MTVIVARAAAYFFTVSADAPKETTLAERFRGAVDEAMLVGDKDMLPGRP